MFGDIKVQKNMKHHSALCYKCPIIKLIKYNYNILPKLDLVDFLITFDSKRLHDDVLHISKKNAKRRA